jgi:hypothetical protein
MLPLSPAKAAFRLSVDVEAIALALAVRVSFQTIAPVEVKPGALQDAVTFFGSPDTMLIVDPPASRAATTPASGVSATVAVAVEAEATEIVRGATLSATPGALTCRLSGWLTLRPSPAAVTMTVAELTAAVSDAVRVKLSLLELRLAAGVCGLADHFAVTPAGSSLTA